MASEYLSTDIPIHIITPIPTPGSLAMRDHTDPGPRGRSRRHVHTEKASHAAPRRSVIADTVSGR
jgi:hypothetical protein